MLTIQAPPSKSVSHRYIMCAALAKGESTIKNVLESTDIKRTIAILSAAGATIHALGNQSYRITGTDGCLHGGPLPGGTPLSCNVHESGTSCRILTALLASGTGRFRIYGAPRMHERPIGQLVTALEALGVHITFEGRNGCPPFLLETEGIDGGSVSIPLDESSQYLSGLLLAAPCTQSGLMITIGGEKVLSWPYVGLTLQTLEDFDITFAVEQQNEGWRRADWRTLTEARPGMVRFLVPPSTYKAGVYTVEGDWSGASYFLAAGAIGPKALRVSGLNAHSVQGDRALLDILKNMGAHICLNKADITVHPSPLHGIDIDMGHCPDLVPTVAMVAAFAQGQTRIHNVAHLRLKESDRIAAPAAELRKAGITVQELDDGLLVTGGTPKAPAETVFHCHGDHRIAMSLALLSLGGDIVHLDEPNVVQKSFPNFWELWGKIL
ncbi:MAG: 3-phosphoshikimate 1-carboxyvinyltransferase [Desulfovibrionaceae bacterium]